MQAPRRRLVLALTALTALAGCTGDRGAAAAAAVVDELQQALRDGDRRRCRELVTEESAAALPDLPWQTLRQKAPLAVLGAQDVDTGWHVAVTDPNAGGRHGTFVVVREYGRPVVDLVATAGLTAVEVVGDGARDELVPRELTPQDLDRIRQLELARPVR